MGFDAQSSDGLVLPAFVSVLLLALLCFTCERGLICDWKAKQLRVKESFALNSLKFASSSA